MGEVSTGLNVLSRLLALERQALLQATSGQRLNDVLEDLLLGLEQMMPGALMSVLVVDPAKPGVLVHGAAPSLPPEYQWAIEPVTIGETVGSCGTAAFRREPVTVEDIAKSPLWAGFHELAAKHRLAACWSTPFFSSRGELLGTFAVYYRDPRAPSASELQLISAVERSVAMLIERTRLTEEAQSARAYFEAIFRGAAEAVIILDEEGRFIDANEAAARLTGWSPAELKTFRVGALAVDPDEPSAVWSQRHTPNGWAGAVQLKRKDGSHVRVEARITRVLLPGRQVFVSSMRQREEDGGDFISVIAHELRNPLGAIHLAAGVLKAKPASAATSADRILRQVKQLDGLITDLHDAQRLEAGRLKLEPVEADLVPLVRTCVAEDGALKLAAPETLPAKVDAERFSQALRRLLAFAVKESGGEVAVTLERRETDAVVKVSYPGHGIEAEVLPHVFERRARGAAGRSFGVGLYLCRVFVEGQGGRVSVESTVDAQTTFTVSIPSPLAGRGPG